MSFLLWPRHFTLSGTNNDCPLLFPSNILDTFQPGGSYSGVISFCLSYCSWSSCGKNTGVICHFFPQWTMFCQNSSLWLICLGWPCMAWLITSMNYTSPFTKTRLWSMKGKSDYTYGINKGFDMVSLTGLQNGSSTFIWPNPPFSLISFLPSASCIFLVQGLHILTVFSHFVWLFLSPYSLFLSLFWQNLFIFVIGIKLI